MPPSDRLGWRHFPCWDFFTFPHRASILNMLRAGSSAREAYHSRRKKDMANKYAGTQTEKNLEAAFAGESQARNKYKPGSRLCR